MEKKFKELSAQLRKVEEERAAKKSARAHARKRVEGARRRLEEVRAKEGFKEKVVSNINGMHWHRNKIQHWNKSSVKCKKIFSRLCFYCEL